MGAVFLFPAPAVSSQLSEVHRHVGGSVFVYIAALQLVIASAERATRSAAWVTVLVAPSQLALGGHLTR